MKTFEKIKENKAVTLTDVIIGMVILILFTGIFTTSFYNIYKHNASIKLDAIAASYAVKIAEDIDKRMYEEVTEKINTSINETYEIPEKFNASIEVSNYNSEDEDREDILKIVVIKIEYKILDETKTYTLRKLKIKEI